MPRKNGINSDNDDLLEKHGEEDLLFESDDLEEEEIEKKRNSSMNLLAMITT